jgi:hypothetical protein
MKVKELIERLQALDPELMVVTNGYEGGVDDVDCLVTEKVALNVNTEWYYGKHEAIYGQDSHEGKEIVDAVRIS